MINRVIVTGRLGKKPERKNGTLRFDIAQTERYHDKNGNQNQRTTWHPCTAFYKTAELIEAMGDKGTELIVEGHLQSNEWTNSQGEMRREYRIIVDRFMVVSKPNQMTDFKRPNYDEVQPTTNSTPALEYDDDVPF